MAADIEAADDGWVTVPPAHIDAWMMTLTNLRLVLASRLGIDRESGQNDAPRLTLGDARRPTAAVYEWCGWLLESLLDCCSTAPSRGP